MAQGRGKVIPFKIKTFTGLNNIDPPEQTKPGELQTANNVDIGNNGQVKRRDGYVSVYTGNIHSLFAMEGLCLFREGISLKRLNTDFTATILRSGIDGNRKMAYLSLNGNIYYSDGIVTGVIQDNVSRTWGMEPPSVPTLTSASGLLREGRYSVVLTWVRNDGQESGSSDITFLDVSQGGGIYISDIPVSSDPTVQYVNVYMTTTNGEIFYLAATVENSVTETSYQGDCSEFTIRLMTQFMSNPPEGEMIEYYNSRVYIAQNNVLWFTENFNYELISLDNGYIIFDSPITLLASNQDGIYLATENETIFMSGDEIPLKRIKIADYGAVKGTSVKMTADVLMPIEGLNLSGVAIFWLSKKGICIGLRGGMFKNMTLTKYLFPESSEGTGLFRQQEGLNSYLVAIQVKN